MNRISRGFTLIELLIVVAIIGIIAAIAIPNLLNALQRGKQKRTMSDMRTISTASESYSIDNSQYVAMAAGAATGITSAMEPTYIKRMPARDGWNQDFQYKGSAAEYTITSFGKDRAAGNNGTVSAAGTTTDFRADIVLTTGTFVQWPDGAQR